MENLVFFGENATKSMVQWVVTALGGLLSYREEFTEISLG